jgi:hypothetical protein
MVKQGDVEKIKTIRNKKLVRVFLYRDSLLNKPGIYSKLLYDKEDKKIRNSQKAQRSAIVFSIIDDKTFAGQLGEFSKTIRA